ncbi:MAG: hypothetical protein OJF49_002390 [Ktedonobacterales bacterium]|nr:MAG: hypothetical protein OJF49_002390 [Ktedonobacterales bacterium]
MGVGRAGGMNARRNPVASVRPVKNKGGVRTGLAPAFMLGCGYYADAGHQPRHCFARAAISDGE